jgi:hypothetical protein
VRRHETNSKSMPCSRDLWLTTVVSLTSNLLISWNQQGSLSSGDWKKDLGYFVEEGARRNICRDEGEWTCQQEGTRLSQHAGRGTHVAGLRHWGAAFRQGLVGGGL